jgi:DNA-binding NarL/FixJ family response regulator
MQSRVYAKKQAVALTALKSENELWSSKMANLSDLTTRELEILQLVIAGKTNKAIASEIEVSAKTVEFHLDNLYTKLDVRTRILAGIWAIQHGVEVEPREIPS